MDDASTDGTADLVQSLADRDPRIVLVRAGENAGASAARNLGLPLVRGEWLTFLDSDDRMLPGAIAALHRAAVATDALAVVGQRIWSDGVDTWITPQYDRPDIREPGRKSLVANPGLMFYASGTGKLFHRSIREGLQFEGRVLGDQPWTLRALLRAGDRIEVIGDVVYEWSRPRPGSEATSITEQKRQFGGACGRCRRGRDRGAARPSAAEADLQLADDASRRLIHAAYLDRLVRADFAGPVSRALDTRDPGTRPPVRGAHGLHHGRPARHRGSLGRRHRAGAPTAARALGSRAPRRPPCVLVDGPCAARWDRRAGSPPQVAARARSTRHRATISGPRRHPARERRGDGGVGGPPDAGPPSGARSIRDGHGGPGAQGPPLGRRPSRVTWLVHAPRTGSSVYSCTVS